MAKILQIIGLATVLLYAYLVLGWVVGGMFGFAASAKFLFLVTFPDWLLREFPSLTTVPFSNELGMALSKILELSLLGAIFIGLALVLLTFVKIGKEILTRSILK